MRHINTFFTILLLIFEISETKHSKMASHKFRHMKGQLKDSGTDSKEISGQNFSSAEIGTFWKIYNLLLQQINSEDGQETQMECLEHSPKVQRIEDVVILQPHVSPGDLSSLLYSTSEPWSRCRRSCTTSRVRKCRLKDLCQMDFVLEDADCYVQGSKCEKIIKSKIRNNNKEKKKQPKKTTTTPSSRPNTTLASSTVSIDYDFAEVENEYSEILEILGVLMDDDYYVPSISFSVYDDYDQEEPTKENEKNTTNDDDIPLPKFNGSISLNNGKCGVSAISVPQTMFRIIGGREAIKNSWPWQVAILNRFKEVFCGGTLIAPGWVLTASHCVRRKLFVRINEHDIRIPDGESEYRVEKSFKHPGFSRLTIDSDIALLKLPSKASNKSITTACLPEPQQPVPFNKTCVTLGWGKTRETHIFGSDVLRFVKVPVVNMKLCKAAYEDPEITENMFCAGRLLGGADACEGDSGGPLLCQDESNRWVVEGVVSFGEGCGDGMRFGVYTKVSNYIGWIWNIINSN